MRASLTSCRFACGSYLRSATGGHLGAWHRVFRRPVEITRCVAGAVLGMYGVFLPKFFSDIRPPKK